MHLTELTLLLNGSRKLIQNARDAGAVKVCLDKGQAEECWFAARGLLMDMYALIDEVDTRLDDIVALEKEIPF